MAPESSPPRKQSFPKSARILKAAEFRTVYERGERVAGPYFAAFCARAEEAGTSRIGFTAPRALGKAVVRNRIKRRMREAVRQRLDRLGPGWRIVINPRRAALDAPFEELTREVERLFTRCKS